LRYGAQAEAKKAAAEARKAVKKAEPLHNSDADTEEEADDAATEHNSDSDADADTEAAGKSRQPASTSTRTARASSKKAAKAIAAALDREGSDLDEPVQRAGSDAETEPTNSPAAAARAAALRKISERRLQKENKGHKSPSSDAVDSDSGDHQKLRKQGSGTSSPEGTAEKQSAAAAKGSSAKRVKKSLGLSSDDPEQQEREVDLADSEAESPVAVMLKSRKLSRADETAVEPNAIRGLFTHFNSHAE